MLQKRTESPFAVFHPRVALQNITAIDSTLYCSAVKRLGLYHRHFGAPVPVFRGKPNTRVISRKVMGCRERGWAGVDFAGTTKDGPEAIVGSGIGRLPHRKWFDFVSPDRKTAVASDLRALGI